MILPIKDMVNSLIRLVSWGYLGLLFAWLVAHLAAGDRSGYLSLLNLLGVYYFLPLPLVLVIALALRSRALGIGCAAGLVAFLWLWGGLFFPRVGSAQAGGRTLTAMTYNVLAYHSYTDPIVDTIRTENADIVMLQELNSRVGKAMQAEMAQEYPYQVLQAASDASGMGVISKFPIQPSGENLPHRWVGNPLILDLDWGGQMVKIVNFHMYSTTRLASETVMEQDFRTRAEQAHLLADFATRSHPVIMGGDANSVPVSDAYKILTSTMQDSWREAGFGFGHTFPGSTVPGSDRPRIGPWYVPPWLVRIDYILHSNDWKTVSARLAKIDGVSDHRGVVVTLQMTK